MDPSHQITFRDFEPTDATRAYVEKHIVKLRTFHSRILSCRVTLSAPHRHQRHGRHYHVALDVNVPGHELLGGKDATGKSANEDLYAAVDDAFEGMKRALKSIAQKQRGHRISKESAMRSIAAGIGVVILGCAAGCVSAPGAEYPEDCVREGAPVVSDLGGVEAGSELDVKDTEQAKVPGRLERDPAWAAEKREAAAARAAERKAKLASRGRCLVI